MKAFFKLTLVVLTVAMLVVACAPAATPTPQIITKVETKVVKETQVVEVTAPPPPAKPKVALVPSGRVDQPGFIGLAGTGYLKACAEFGLTAKYWEGTTLEEWERNVRSAAEEGYDLIIGVGSTMADAIKNVAPEYPNLKFALVDQYVGGDNVEGLVAQEHEGTFLAGALMALMTVDTNLAGINDKKVIGFVGGMDIPVIHRFLGGVTQGAQYIDPDIKIEIAYVGSFANSPKAKELALTMFKDQDVDIVYSVAGSFGDAGTFEAVKETGLYGVASDVNWDSEVPGHILTSVLKKTDLMVRDCMARFLDGKFQSGEHLYGVDGGYMALTDMSVMGEGIPQSVKDRLAELKTKIGSGQIKVERWQ
jgi:basic membrane protein A